MRDHYGLNIDPTLCHVLLVYLDVEACKAHGDPSYDGAPRQDHNGHFMWSSRGLNRLSRDYWALQGEEVFLARGSESRTERANNYDDDIGKIRSNCLDVILFGGVIPLGGKAGADGRITGAIQTFPARSIDPVHLLRDACTAVVGEKHDDGSDRANMGATSLVSYALVEAARIYSPYVGAQNGVTSEHLAKFHEASIECWERSRSTTRSGVTLRDVVQLTWSPKTRGLTMSAIKERFVSVNRLTETYAGGQIEIPKEKGQYEIVVRPSDTTLVQINRWRPSDVWARPTTELGITPAN